VASLFEPRERCAMRTNERGRGTVRTLYDVAIWHHVSDGEMYAFPLGADEYFLADADMQAALGKRPPVPYPQINSPDWQFKGALPKGMAVINVEAEAHKRVRCTIAGVSVMTADWVLS
jgi:hypothetical protein